jgi:NhaP-type Na+/H+ and K+/H+ antiporter
MPLLAAADSLDTPLAVLGVTLIGGALEDGEVIFNLAALVVFCSIIVHGLTDTPGAERMGRYAERRDAAQARAG